MTTQNLQSPQLMPIDAIKIGARAREELGDLDMLAQNISEIGLLQPIVVTPDGMLIAGQRRLRAWEKTQFREQPIPVHIVDLELIARGELSENSFRKAFTPSEMVKISEAIIPAARASAKENQRHGLTAPGRKKDLKTPKIWTWHIVAKFCGISPKTLRNAAAVVAAAKRDPIKFGHLVKEMDRTGKVDASFKRLRDDHFRKVERGDLEKKITVFDEVLPPSKAIGDVKAFEAIRNARFWTYLVEHMGVPNTDAESMREFIKPSLVKSAWKHARHRRPTNL